MTNRVLKMLEEARTLSEPERLDLAEQLLASVPQDAKWLAELERRAQRAHADPEGGIAWELAQQRLAARAERR